MDCYKVVGKFWAKFGGGAFSIWGQMGGEGRDGSYEELNLSTVLSTVCCGDRLQRPAAGAGQSSARWPISGRAGGHVTGRMLEYDN
mgnify:CR=1 FL=1